MPKLLLACLAICLCACAANKTITVRLPANATTGYGWDYKIENPGILEEKTQIYIAPDSNLAGAGGVQEYIFKAAKNGETKIIFNYSRPWEKTAPIKTIEKRYKVSYGKITELKTKSD